MTLGGYRIKEKLYEGRNSLVYRGQREEQPQEVILKLLKEEYPSAQKLAALWREYQLLCSLQLPGVIHAYEFTTDPRCPVMVLEDFGGVSLAQFRQNGRIPVPTLLPLAIQLVDVIGQVHQQHVIHKDVTPANIAFNPHTEQLKLIDFGIATQLSRETPFLQQSPGCEGTLAYMSPEQTGRLNRVVDYRTDFYSLGVTFYELLTGRLPFLGTDVLALIHAHIAQQPPPPHELVPEIPPLLSAIVMKLLAKNAEDRYQSASGLIADLQEGWRQWRESGTMLAFPLGHQEARAQLQIPQTLYGREEALHALRAAFTRVEQGARELLLVSGPAGSGKTALVQEVYRPIARQQRYFITGKFEQFQRNIPYAALAQAFRVLVQQILTESEEQISAWKDALTTALESNLQVVIEVIPEVALIVGPQPAVPLLPPVEAQNRLHLAFQNFVRVFTGPERPLILFLDDLQWADRASLHLLHILLTATENSFLLVLCAYRDTEVTAVHPVQLMVNDIRKEGGTVNHLLLGSLPFPSLQQFIADTLCCSPEKAAPLAELVLTKTAGNPFFVSEFLTSLFTAGLLTFAPQAREWQWEMEHLRAQNITDNVVELIVGKVQQLGVKTQAVLKLAACLGNQFDLRTLAALYEKSFSETAAELWPALVEGFILPLSDAYTLVGLDVQGLSDEVAVEYKFSHDRIQHAVYSLIPPTDKHAVHWQIGQLLWRQTVADEQEAKIFLMANHLNLGKESIRDVAQRSELAAFNLTAGKKAKAAAAYEPAFRYLQSGLELLPQDAWEHQYELALTLHVETAEAAYLSGEWPQMEQLTTLVLRRANSPLDRVKAYEVILHAYSARNNVAEGAKVGIQVLELLGEQLPHGPSQADIFHGLEATQHMLVGRRIEDLLHLPPMTDPYAIAKMRVLSSMITLVYAALPQLFPLLVCRMVTLSVLSGNHSLSAQAYAMYGILLCGASGDIETGHQFGTLATQLVTRLDAKELHSSVTYMVQTFVRHWKEHIRETLPALREGYQRGLKTGDLIFGTMNAQGYGFQAYWCGVELSGLEREMAKYSEAIRQLKQDQALNINDIYRQFVQNLLGRSADPCRLVGECYDENMALPLRVQANDINTLCFLYTTKVVLCCLFQQYRQALAHAEEADKYLASLLGTAAIPGFHFYDSLARLAIWPQADEAEQKSLAIRVEANQDKMKLWAQHAPMNYGHKFSLIEAERARVAGNDRDAREYYDQAIDGAREHGYVNDEALANELAAKFYLARGQTRLAQYYLREAHDAYTRWGAKAKVQNMEAHYPKFLAPSTSDLSRNVSSTTFVNMSQRLSSAFDFTSVVKASQAISREIVLDQLLTALMKIVLENAGAQRGFLLLEKEGRLVIEAEGDSEKDEVTVLQSIPVETNADLPITIVHYVQRMQEPLVFSSTMPETVFAADPYLVRRRPQSILCVPLVKQGKLIGLIYLENNLTANAFTSDRVEIVSLLSAEAATAIENARLYRSLEEAKERLADYSKTLEQKVAGRTQELEEKNRALESANQQVLEANRRKSQFLAGMSHQLRTPMNAILGFTRLVLRRAGDQLPERQRENLSKVRESAENLLVLINDLLDLSKIEAGRMEVRPAFFAVSSFLRSCCESVSPLLKPEVQLRHELSGEAGDAYTDEDGLRQVLLNLLSNALKFTHRGEVVVRAWVERPGREDAVLTMTISDTGVGIPHQALSRIFEEFQQVENEVQKHEGTGLGLPIAKKWVELLGGTITVESELGKGSTFTVSVPVLYHQQRKL